MAEPTQTIVITGAAGFLGSALAEALGKRFRLIGLDLSEPEQPTAGMSFIKTDFSSDESVSAAWREAHKRSNGEIAAVIHLAAYYDLTGEPNPKYEQVTVEGTRVILRYGRIGTEGRKEEFGFDGEAQAQSFAQRKIDEKLRKGYQHAQPGVTQKKPIEKPVLDERGVFWRLIELSRKGSEGDLYMQLDNLRERLMKLTEEEVRSFDRILWELMDESYRADLWGAAYVIKGGCSDDGFDYFRAWLIMQGERI